MSIIIRKNIVDTKISAYMSVSFITFFQILLILLCIIVYMVVRFVCFSLVFYITYSYSRWRSWLRQCATSRKVAGSIPDGVTGIFH